jgi:uncharacterized protein YjbJ (UPF0337 family)
MRNDSKRVEGVAEELGGKIRGGFGKLIGNKQMEASGKACELEGAAKQQAAKAAECVQGKMVKFVGAVKYRVGAMIENEHPRIESRAGAPLYGVGSDSQR